MECVSFPKTKKSICSDVCTLLKDEIPLLYVMDINFVTKNDTFNFNFKSKNTI